MFFPPPVVPPSGSDDDDDDDDDLFGFGSGAAKFTRALLTLRTS